MGQEQSLGRDASSDADSASRRDFRREVTQQFVAMLEAGTAPWQKPWEPGSLQLPFNPTSDRSYRGGNALHLMATAAQKGYDDPRWLTFRQAVENGWHVRESEKGTHVEYWQFGDSAAKQLEVAEPNGQEQRMPETGTRATPVHRVYTVFNASQVEGIPPYVPRQRQLWEVAHTGEDILRNSVARIAHDQNDRAFYSRAEDAIHLPPKAAFRNAADYYATALHELAHWTGHPERLNRKTLNESYSFGDTSYAKEELRAELASVFLAAERGIPHDPQQHAAYVGSWIKALNDDKNEIFRAARDAQKAADFLLALERNKPPEMRRETSAHVADYERGRGTVNIIEKETATENRNLVVLGGSPAPDAQAVVSAETEKILDGEVEGRRPLSDTALKQSLAVAEAKAKELLGSGARLYSAHADSGNYRGEIVGESQHHVIQKLSGRSAVAHPKHLLPHAVASGANVTVAYSNNQVEIKPIRVREKAQTLSR